MWWIDQSDALLAKICLGDLQEYDAHTRASLFHLLLKGCGHAIHVETSWHSRAKRLRGDEWAYKNARVVAKSIQKGSGKIAY
jgi:hypothetical protein